MRALYKSENNGQKEMGEKNKHTNTEMNIKDFFCFKRKIEFSS